MADEACVLRLLALIGAHLALLPPLVVAVSALARLEHPVLDLLAHFTLPALAATVVLTLILALMQLAPAVISAMAVTGLLVLACWPQWFPDNRPYSPAGDAVLSLYTANLWVHNQDIDKIAASSAHANADVLIMVEFGPTARAQLDQLFSQYPYRIYAGRSDHPSHSAIMSRYPLTAIPDHSHPETVAARIDSPLGPINLIGAHLTRPWPYQPPHRQVEQALALSERVMGLDGPVIMAGDFNAVSSGRIGRLIKGQTQLIPAPAWPGTWPRALPSALGITIDHIWYSPDLYLSSRRTGLHSGSDHRPVLTHFKRAAPRP